MHAHAHLGYTLLGLPPNNKATALQNRCFHTRPGKTVSEARMTEHCVPSQCCAMSYPYGTSLVHFTRQIALMHARLIPAS
jgi:hypothetical protein